MLFGAEWIHLRVDAAIDAGDPTDGDSASADVLAWSVVKSVSGLIDWEAAWRGAFPGLPLVGHERGDDLTAMLALGFQRSGSLRVWITSD